MVLTFTSHPSHPLQWCLHRRTQLNLLERRSTGSWKRDLKRRGEAAPPAEGEVRRDNLFAKSFMRHVAFNLIKLLLVVEDYPQYITSRSKKKFLLDAKYKFNGQIIKLITFLFQIFRDKERLRFQNCPKEFWTQNSLGQGYYMPKFWFETSLVTS